MKRSMLSIAVVVLLVSGTQGGPVIDNPGFEAPDLGSGSGAFQYGPTIAQQGGSGWTFFQGAGIAANGSAFNVANAVGHQAAFIQDASGETLPSAFSQTVSGFDSGEYSLSFLAEGRPNKWLTNPLIVLIDSTVLSFAGTSVVNPAAGSIFYSYTSDLISLSAGSHTITFETANPGSAPDRTTFIDDVSLTTSAVPEPSAFILLAAGVVGLLGFARRDASSPPSSPRTWRT